MKRSILIFILALSLIFPNGCAHMKGIEKDRVFDPEKKKPYYVAKKGSILFHKSDCQLLKATGYLTNSEEKVIFHSKKIALRKGFVSCPFCNPEEVDKEERSWFSLLFAILLAGLLTNASISASFGAQGFFLGIED